MSVCEECGEPGEECSLNGYWIKTLCKWHQPPGVMTLATQDTEPLTTDARRIVELERLVELYKLSVEVEKRAHEIAIQKAMALQVQIARQSPVLLAALTVGRHWNDQDAVNAQYIDALDALADAVQAFDALQPKG